MVYFSTQIDAYSVIIFSQLIFSNYLLCLLPGYFVSPDYYSDILLHHTSSIIMNNSTSKERELSLQISFYKVVSGEMVY